MTPSLRFPLPAGGTELAHGMVPLAKRGNLKEGVRTKLCPRDWYN